MTRDEFAAGVLLAHDAALLEDTERKRNKMLGVRAPGGGVHWPHAHLSPWAYRMMETSSYGIRNEFHDRGGLTYSRLKCGCVAICSWLPERQDFVGYDGVRDEIWRRSIITIIEPNVWASIVCSVSDDGETGERWEAQRTFHGKPPAADEKPILAALSPSAPPTETP